MIVNAELTLTLYKTEYWDGTTPSVHRVLGPWSEGGVTWNNQPAFDQTAVDYETVTGGDLAYQKFDITSIVKEWYSMKDNYGLALTSPYDSVQTYAEYYASDTDVYYREFRPFAVFMYVNNSGVEDFWTYHSVDNGRAGTGFVNDYNGNLIFIHEDARLNSEKTPISIKHVYNSNNKGKNTNFGYGWMINYDQKLSYDQYYDRYKYIDEDGTEKYFIYKSPNLYEDELGLDLKLEVNSASTTERFVIKDKTNNKLIFNSGYQLLKLRDNTSNEVNIAYEMGRISKVIDASNREIVFTYNGNFLSQITMPDSKKIQYYYSGDRLVKIIYNDNLESNYEYDSNNNLVSVRNIDNNIIKYSYYNQSPYRVKSVSKDFQPVAGAYNNQSAGFKKGLELQIAYGNNETIFTDYKGKKNYYQFNKFGNTVMARDHNGKATYYNFSSAKPNELSLLSDLQETVVNKVKNHSFEIDAAWYDFLWDGTTGTTSYDSIKSKDGNKSIKINQTSALGGTFKRQAITLEKGKTYTYSSSILVDELKSGKALVLAYVRNSAGEWVKKEGNAFTSKTSWEKSEVTFTIPSDATSADVLFQVGIIDGIGTAYFDSTQLEENSSSSRYNLIENGDFNNSLNFFTKTGTQSASDVIEVVDKNIFPMDNNAYKIVGNPKEARGLKQTVSVKGIAGDTFVYAAFSKGNSVSLSRSAREVRDYAINITIHNTDGTTTSRKTSFNPSSNEWQYISDVIVSTKNYNAITYEINYSKNMNTAYFDGLQLYKEEFGTSYTYDSNGNVISTKGIDKNGTAYTYTNNDITKIVTSENKEYKYNYDASHNLTSMVSPTNVTTSFTYDQNGNVTKTRISGASLFIDSKTEYDATGTYVKKEIDARGNVIEYSFNNTNGNLNNVKNPNNVITEYTYDSMDKIKTVTNSNKTVTYSYNNDNLITISANGVNYTFIYDEFGNQTEVKVNNKSLIRRTFQVDGIVNTGRLENQIYGNGDTISYIYDNENRIIEKRLNGVKKYEYKYDNSSVLKETFDVDLNLRTYYKYDPLGRLVEVKLSTGDSTNFIYDQYNKVSEVIEKYGNIFYSTVYTYDSEGRIINTKYSESPNIIGTDYFTLSGNANSLSLKKPFEDSSIYTTDEKESKVLSKTSGLNKIDLNINKNAGTFTGWIKVDAGSGYRAVITNRMTTVGMASVYINPNNKLEFRLTNSAGNNYQVVESTNTVPLNQWVFVGVRYSTTNSVLTATVFLNDTKNTGTTSDFIDFTNATTLFGTNVSGNEKLPGLMSNVAYIPKSITDAELTAIYNQNRGMSVSYTYDAIGRLNKKTTYAKTITKVEEYKYHNGVEGATTTLISEMKEITKNSENIEISNLTTNYEYDNIGNVIKMSNTSGINKTYKYDSLNQLTEEYDHQKDEKTIYIYEGIGNIKTSVKYKGKNEYRYMQSDGKWSAWTSYQDLNSINRSNQLTTIPNLGSKGSMYDLKNFNANTSIVSGNDSIEFNGLNTRASSRKYLEFNGTNSNVQIPSIDVSDTDEVTLTAKIYWDGSPQESGRGTIITKQGSYYLQLMNDGKIAVFTYSDIGDSTYDYSTQSIPQNEWVNVAFTEKNGLRKIYINGNLDVTSQKESGIRQNGNNTEIGSQVVPNNRYFKGNISEATIWNRELSIGEIQDINLNRMTSNQNGLKGYYTFDGRNTTLVDNSSNNNNGTINNATYPTLNENYLSFNGLNSYVTLPGVDVSATDELTMSARVYWDGSTHGSGKGTILSFSGSYYLQLLNDGGIAVYTYPDTGDSVYNHSIAKIEKNKWVDIVFTEKAGLRKIYINGILDSQYQKENSIRTKTGSMYIGGEHSNTMRYFNGKITNVGLWNRALNEKQVQSLTKFDLANVSNGLQAFYSFEGSGDVLKDISGNNRDGIISNTSYQTKEQFDAKTIYLELNTASFLNPSGLGGLPLSFDENEYVYNPSKLDIVSGSYRQRTTTNSPLGTKFKVAVIWNGTNYEFYVDGVKKESYVHSGTPTLVNITEVVLGCRMTDNSYYYQGAISDIRVSSKTITEEQAIEITSTPNVNKILDERNTEIVYNLMETRYNMEEVSIDNYTYETDWKDQLKEYNGYTYTYDNIGNPIKIEKDGITYRTFTWESGRRLKKMYVKGTNDIEITYKYNEEGIRVEKSIKNLSNNQITTTTYKLQGNKVIEEKTNNTIIHYYYDVNNSLIGFKYNNKNYFYQKTILNDIIGIVNEEGTTVVNYEYDAYGNIINIEDTSGINIGNINSYKYKDYYYDTESSYYYLNSRYYNPEVRRFINVDGYVSSASGIFSHNMYLYSNCNPINYSDSSGKFPFAIVGAITAVIASAAVSTKQMVDNHKKIGKITFYDWAQCVSEGAAVGASIISFGLVAQSINDFNRTNSILTYEKTNVLKNTEKVTRGSQNPAISAAIKKGQVVHKNWNYGPNTFKEFRITPSYRVDAIDFSNKLIYELKPNNPNAEKRGYMQLNNYVKAASSVYGGDWTGILIKYD